MIDSFIEEKMKFDTQENTTLLIRQALVELESIGLQIPKEILFKDISAARTHGWCRKTYPNRPSEKGFKYVIGISKFIRFDSDKKNTIMHELLHALIMENFKEAAPHGKEWKYYAKVVNEKLGQNITRCCNLQLTIKPKPKRRRRKIKIIFLRPF